VSPLARAARAPPSATARRRRPTRPHDEDLLGGKGANLAEMSSLGLPVPPGFTITTEVCTLVLRTTGSTPRLASEVSAALAQVEKELGKRFGDAANPLLVSVRSGARVSMPGMMDTVLNLGLNDTTVEGLARAPANGASPTTATAASSRCTATSSSRVIRRRRNLRGRARPARKHEQRRHARHRPHRADDWKELVAEYKAIVKQRTRQAVPAGSGEQLWGAIGAVFGSWMNQRAIAYRRLHDIPDAGAPPSTSSPWSSATWATTRAPASPSRATPRPARTSSTAST
jgi:pyruvate,orthophosphate dikinase